MGKLRPNSSANPASIVGPIVSISRGPLWLRNLSPKLPPFFSNIVPHHERQIRNDYPSRNTIDQRFIHQLTKRLAVIEIFAQELFELGGVHALCGSPLYTIPSLFSGRRRECQREIILASLGDIEGEQPMSLTPWSRLHEPSDLSHSIRLICALGTVPICRQIVPLKWRKFPLKPCPEAEQWEAWKEC